MVFNRNVYYRLLSHYLPFSYYVPLEQIVKGTGGSINLGASGAGEFLVFSHIWFSTLIPRMSKFILMDWPILRDR